MPLETFKSVYLEETFEFDPPKACPKSLLELLWHSFNMSLPVVAKGLRFAGIGLAGLAIAKMVTMVL